jgi:hypothetical protein
MDEKIETKKVRIVVLTTGSIPKLHIQMGVLEDAGISSWIRDETIKVVDPFITGGNVLDADLMVSATDLEAARACLPLEKEVVKNSRANRWYWFLLLFLVVILPAVVAALL